MTPADAGIRMRSVLFSYIVRITLAVHCTNGNREPPADHRRRHPGLRRRQGRGEGRREGGQARAGRGEGREEGQAYDRAAGKVATKRPGTRRWRRRPRKQGQGLRARAPSSSARSTSGPGRRPSTRRPRFTRDEIADDRDSHRRRRRVRRGLDAAHRDRARRGNDDALPLRAHEGRAAHAASSTR